MTLEQGTYVIKRDADNQYLTVASSLVGVAGEDHKWIIEHAVDDSFYIKDPVTGGYLKDNGVSGYQIDATQLQNSEWTGLSSGPPRKIYNKSTNKALLIPYGKGDLAKWELSEPGPVVVPVAGGPKDKDKDKDSKA